MASSLPIAVLLLLLLTPAALSLPLFPDSDDSFHAVSCPPLDSIVLSSVQAALRQEIALAAGLIRIFFHDCFPQGCDASVYLIGTGADEVDMGPNLTLQRRAMQLVESIRAKAHAACGPTVSCADISALATRAAVVVSGGPSYSVPLGQLDSFVPAAQDRVFQLPAPNTASVAILVESFATRGLADVADLVALSGAHTVGRSQCSSFADRSARMDDTFSRKLAANCSKHPARLQNLDVVTPDLFDNGYYKALTFNQGVFTSDMALIKNRTSAAIVRQFAESKEAFFNQFARSMTKLANAPRPGGNVGEIRRNCFTRNVRQQAAAAASDIELAGEEEGFKASA